MSTGDSTLEVTIGFVPHSVAEPDAEHPGLLRAGPRGAAPYARESVERHECAAIDLCHEAVAPPDLFELGFDTVDLSLFADLQELFPTIADAGRIEDSDAASIRSTLQGATLRGANGRELTVLHLADEGLIMRTAGPNGLAVVGPVSSGMNDHGGATSIHADQDVFGTPMRQLMDGRAPTLFRHDSPDGRNRDAGLMLVNLWIPLQQITQPLVLADGRSIDRRRHQLRFGLATDSFLDRDDVAINDIWTFLHHPDQRWYVRSEMDHRHGYVFDTLSTAHGACTLPGEDVAERAYLALGRAETALDRNDMVSFVEAVTSLRDLQVPDGMPAPLRAAIEAMAAVGSDGIEDPDGLRGAPGTAWARRARTARRRVVRMSLEMRMVVSVDV